MRAMVVEVGPEIEQLVFEVCRRPEQHVIEVFPPQGADLPFHEWMGQGDVGDGLDFYHLQYPQIGLPLVEPIERIIVRVEVVRHPVLASNGAVEHPTQRGTIDRSRMDAEPHAHYHYALFLLDRQRDKEAEGELQEELKFNSSSALPLLCLAQMALDRGDVPRILELTARAHQIEPESFVAYYLDGRSFMKSGDWEQARHSLEEAEGRAPRSAEIHFSLATVYQKLNRPQDAERERALFVRDSAKDRQ